MIYALVAQVRNTNNVVVNSLFYNGLQEFRNVKNGKINRKI